VPQKRPILVLQNSLFFELFDFVEEYARKVLSRSLSRIRSVADWNRISNNRQFVSGYNQSQDYQVGVLAFFTFLGGEYPT